MIDPGYRSLTHRHLAQLTIAGRFGRPRNRRSSLSAAKCSGGDPLASPPERQLTELRGSLHNI